MDLQATSLPKIWLRTRVDPGKPGRAVDENDVDVLLRGSARVYKPNGDLLLVYRKSAIPLGVCEKAREAFAPIRNHKSMNRGVASGERVTPVRSTGVVSHTSEGAPVRSSIVGFFDRYPRIPYCRKTAFNADHPGLFSEGVRPLCVAAAEVFRAEVPDRFAIQMREIKKVHPAWVIAGTPYTTLTVNHDWPTRLHHDRGDFKPGFSNMAVIRTGRYEGAWIVFPGFRVGIDMGMGDLIMFDSHEWHANTPMTKHEASASRCSVVLYMREKMIDCGSPDAELARAKELRGGFAEQEDEEDYGNEDRP